VKLLPTQILIAPVVSEKSYHMIQRAQILLPPSIRTPTRRQVRQAGSPVRGQVESVNIISVPSKPKRRGLSRGRRPGWKEGHREAARGRPRSTISRAPRSRRRGSSEMPVRRTNRPAGAPLHVGGDLRRDHQT